MYKLSCSKDLKGKLTENYPLAVAVVEERLNEHPEYANHLIQKSLKVLEREQITPETYLEMFKVINAKIKEKPELSDCLPKNALDYQKSKVKPSLFSLKDLLGGKE